MPVVILKPGEITSDPGEVGNRSKELGFPGVGSHPVSEQTQLWSRSVAE